MDFGFSVDPSTLVGVRVDKDRKQIELKEYLYKPELTTSELFTIGKRIAGGSLIVADSAEPRLIAELRQRGLNIVPAIKGPGSVNAGIAMLQDYELIVDEGSENLQRELNNYAWLEKKVSPVDKFNHLIDAVRYAVYYQLERPNRGSYHVR
jgi:phage terminase large subunit